MKKSIFTATLLITIIFITFLAFSDGNKNEVKITRSVLSEPIAIPSHNFKFPQLKFEVDREYSDQTEMDFRVCG